MGEDLEKMVLRPHHRRRTAIVVTAATAIAGVQALTLALVLRREPALAPWTPPTFVVHEAAPMIVEQVIAAQPTMTTTRPACPPVGDSAPSAKSVTLPDGVSHVVTAHTNAGWIAAWSDDILRVSYDGGRTFARLLDGPGAVREVTFDCYGRVAVIRGEKLGTRDGVTERWTKLPHVRGDSDAPIALVGGGPDVVVVGISNGSESWEARVAVTPDLGASWWFRDVTDYWETSNVTGRQDADGSIHMTLTTADCMSDPVGWFRIKDGIVESEDLGSISDVRLFGDYAINSNWRDGVRWKKWGDAE